ncbi:HEPN domain-containing protein [Streptomyces sp. FH025]|uniref:HEPN domain-containing protein n=1 Tax=Streptomyces sp. FH025 TaxID=2815937 RepID=UPI001A9DB492|nr:HEPN domain-containing protein [Streptomyces sp. FH025]MBO1418886.1 hypothetical protein [Streptomyces sp. FH025]
MTSEIDIKGAVRAWLQQVGTIAPESRQSFIWDRFPPQPSWRAVRQAVTSAAPATARPDLYVTRDPDRIHDRVLLDLTGLAAFAQRTTPDDLRAQDIVAREFERFCLAPAPVSEDWVLLEASFPPDTRIPIGDYVLQTFTEPELRQLQALPSVDDLPFHSSFPADVLAGAAFLRRPDAERELLKGARFSPAMRSRPELLHWQPLLILMLWSSELTRMQASYEVEPGRRVGLDHGTPGIETHVAAADDDVMVEYEVHEKGFYEVLPEDRERFAAFCAWADDRIRKVQTQGGKRQSRRLSRSAQHLVRAMHRTYTGEYVPEEEIEEVLLHYVIAIEALMADENNLDLSRKVQIRAATLWRTDRTRQAVADTLKKAYAARSKYVHGDEIGEKDKDKVDLAVLRHVAFQTLLRWLIIATSKDNVVNVPEVLDGATLSDAIRQNDVLKPIDAFYASTPPAWRPTDTPDAETEEKAPSPAERRPRPRLSSGWGPSATES